MPKSINGIGTRYYGEAEPRADSSYVTTEWFAIFLLPIIPLRSFRVIRETSGDRFTIFGHSASYQVLERLPLAWAQVLKTYLFFVICLAWWVACCWAKYHFLANWHPSQAQQWMLLIFVAPVPFYLLGLSRWRAKRAAKNNETNVA